MKLLYTLFMVFSSLSLFAANATDTNIKAANAPYNQALKTMENKSEQKQLMQQAQQGAMAQKMGSPEVMIIDPSIRAQDFKEAFNYLMQYKAGSPIYFELQDKEKLYNVLDLSLMKGGSIMIFRINTTQGVKYRVVKIEDVSAIGTD